MIKKIITCYLLLCNVLVAGTIRPDVPDEAYLKHGSNYECVIKLSGKYVENSEYLVSGSAVVLNKNYIITAAHVLEHMKDPYFYINEKKYIVKKTFANKDFDINAPISYGDIAVCFVQEEIIINNYPKLYTNKDEMEKICDLVGFGSVGLPFGGEKKLDHKRRAGTNKISSVSEFVIFCSMSEKNQTRLEFLTSHGDSGGGLFIDGKLAGIHSFVSCSDGIPDSSYGDESGHTRISAFVSWIEQIISK